MHWKDGLRKGVLRRGAEPDKAGPCKVRTGRLSGTVHSAGAGVSSGSSEALPPWSLGLSGPKFPLRKRRPES